MFFDIGVINVVVNVENVRNNMIRITQILNLFYIQNITHSHKTTPIKDVNTKMVVTKIIVFLTNVLNWYFIKTEVNYFVV